MRSDLFQIPMEWNGVPIFGPGLLLALWLVGVGIVLYSARNSKQSFNDLIAQWPFFLLVSAAIYLMPRFFAEGLPIRGYGVMLVLAGATGLGMAIYRARKSGIDGDTIVSLTFWMFVVGIAGARIFFVVQKWESFFANKPLGNALLDALNFTIGGLVVYGAVIGAAIAFVVYCRINQLRVLQVADIIAPSLLAGLALGRIGCLLHGCCYGGPCDLSWQVTFPYGSPPYTDQVARGEMYGFRIEQQTDGTVTLTRVDSELAAENPAMIRGAVVESINATEVKPIKLTNGTIVTPLDVATDQIVTAYGEQQKLVVDLASDERVVIAAVPIRQRSLPIHPTQIYSAINATLMSLLLWFFYRVRRYEGAVIGLAFTIYPVARFLLEDIRTDETSFLGTGFSISQNVSILLLAIMPLYWWWILRRPQPEPTEQTEPSAA